MSFSSTSIKKFLLSFIILITSFNFAYADVLSEDFETQKDRAGNLIDFKTDTGLRIKYMGTFRPEITSNDQVGAGSNDNIFSVFMVKSDKDTSLRIDIREGVDTKTNKFRWREGEAWGYIAENETNGTARDILEDIWVRVVFWHTLPYKPNERTIIGRVGFVINDNEINYKRIRPRSWAEWVEVEQEVIKLEEGDDDFSDDENDDFGAKG